MDNKILIRETIDGKPVAVNAAAAAPSRKATSSKTKKEAAVLKADPYIWGIYISLLIFSIIELFSASSSEVVGNNVYAPLIRHCIFLALGLAMVLWLQKLHYKYFSHYALALAVGSLVLLIASSYFGIEINGAQRAIRVAGMTIQPAEIVKLTVIIWLAKILSRNQRPGGVATKGVVYAAFVVLAFGGCLWKNGLTNTLLLMGVSFAMFLIGGIPMKKLGIVALCYVVGAAGLYSVKYAGGEHEKAATEFQQISQGSTAVAQEKDGGGRAETHKNRVSRFFEGVHPDDPINDINRQVIMANFSQANGGLFGQGPGNSRESARLPLAFSDYIYSIIVEDTGFVGGVILLILYLWLMARAGSIAYKCSRALPAFLILGCAVLIVLQALAHMCIVTGVVPVSGQPLPLISKGGTSVLVMSAAIGIMLSVSRYAAANGNRKHEQAEINELPEELAAANMASNTTPHN